MSQPQVVKIPKSINKKVLYTVEKIVKFLLVHNKSFSVSFDNNSSIEDEEDIKKIEGNSISVSIDNPVEYGDIADFIEKLGFIAVNGVENKIVQYIGFEQSLFQEEWEKDIAEKETKHSRKVARIIVILKGTSTNDKSTVDFIMVYPKILIWKK